MERKKRSKTNDNPTNRATRDILQCLFNAGVYAWRQNVLPVPMVRGGVVVGFRPGSKQGLPDIMGIIPAGLLSENGNHYGIPLWVEVKTGNDSLRPEQIGAHFNAKKMGAIVIVVKDFEDFLEQWNKILNKKAVLQTS